MSIELTQPTLRARRSAGRSRPGYTDFEIDLAVIEIGLRLKALPIDVAIARGKSLALSQAERKTRQQEFLQLCQVGPLPVVDEGLFADAVVRHPEVAATLAAAPRSLALTLHQPFVFDPE